MPKQIRSAISDIASSIKTKLMADLEYLTERVIWWGRDKPPDYQGTPFLILRMRRMVDLGEGWDGAGRHDTCVQRILDVGIKVAIDTDTTSDAPWMFDETLGYFPIELAVMDSLIEFTPRDSAKNVLTIQPLSLVGALDAARYPDALTGATSFVSFKILHNLDLTPIGLAMNL